MLALVVGVSGGRFVQSIELQVLPEARLWVGMMYCSALLGLPPGAFAIYPAECPSPNPSQTTKLVHPACARRVPSRVFAHPLPRAPSTLAQTRHQRHLHPQHIRLAGRKCQEARRAARAQVGPQGGLSGANMWPTAGTVGIHWHPALALADLSGEHCVGLCDLPEGVLWRLNRRACGPVGIAARAMNSCMQLGLLLIGTPRLVAFMSVTTMCMALFASLLGFQVEAGVLWIIPSLARPSPRLGPDGPGRRRWASGPAGFGPLWPAGTGRQAEAS
jgi:hypothetical protein